MTRTGVAVGIVGGLGAGSTFAASIPMGLDFLGLTLFPARPGSVRALDFLPVLFIAAAAVTAMVAGRFGWVVTGVAAVAMQGLGQLHLDLRTPESVTTFYGAITAAQGMVLGGALAALAAADRTGRRAIAPALAAGAVGGLYLLWTFADASRAGLLDHDVARALPYSPRALCVVAGIGALVALVRRRGTGTGAEAVRRDWVPPATCVVAGSAAIVYVAIAATKQHEAVYAAAAAATVIAAVAGWRAGPLAAAFALVGFGAGSATTIDELLARGYVTPWQFAAAAFGGVALGWLLARLMPDLPWEGVGLAGAGVALLASHSPSLREMAEGRLPYPTGLVIAVALVGLATTAMLVRLGDRLPDTTTAVVAGFASFVVAGFLAAPMSGFVLGAPVWDQRAIAVGVAGAAVLALHLVGRRGGATSRTSGEIAVAR